ncbi:sigma-54 interaction domain-containing protein [Psychrobacillus lasiicapitis]|uniref:AAA family ATPase n=1 Tax=Psychrobacillus lasiicapitis TaxID=1636719 RepID=A0A544TH00_9BACI|nr:sigma 54-interacting transcriptional regulator [Psychrobacillus lasiicapitis]TQR16734.1 AAA family ATPase [Psychrobacillus lasiicapitis]GGA27643.1 arginine utilization regulatory protein RocR [Psychrobacillus lasiicapitis]
MSFAELNHLSDYDNVLVVDANGITIFYDLADLHILKHLGLKPEEFLRKSVTSFYKNLSIEDSTLMTVLRTGKPLWNAKQELTSNNGFTYTSRSSTFPIHNGTSIVGAIEFSKHYYQKEDIQLLDQFASHKMYRKNNTIYTIDNLISQSSVMEEIKNKVRKVSITDSTILINGQTGTGKEIIAQSIHNLSSRYTQPFISINCGEIPPTFIEHILFGTETDPLTSTPDILGILEQANGGTIFLDEISALDIKLQAKLLKVIEDKLIRRVGGKQDIHLNIRVIAATNENPEKLMREKLLREDLYYRLSVFQLDLPPLSDRKEDITALIHYFIEFYNRHMQIKIEKLDDQVLLAFQQYNWPGNVRELKNAIETAYNNASSKEIHLYDIPAKIRNYSSVLEKITISEDNFNLKDKVEEYEKNLIVIELSKTGGKLAETARRLGISKQLLKYKMEKYELR